MHRDYAIFAHVVHRFAGRKLCTEKFKHRHNFSERFPITITLTSSSTLFKSVHFAPCASRSALPIPCPNSAQESSRVDTPTQVLRRERKHLVVEASGISRMRSQRHYEAFLHCAFWVFCLALHHHQGTDTTPAISVMTATHDSVLITQSAVSVGTVKQPECIGGRIGLRHAIASAQIQVAVVMHMHTRPVALMCTGLSSSLPKMSWYDMPARQITLQSRHEEK